MTTDPRGSSWRRWDLHFHTPASYDYRNKSLSAKDLVDGLIANGIQVVAVTDHHVIDTKYIQAMRDAAGSRLTILPGIEMTSELGGSEHVHYIGIFSDESNIEDIWIKLQGQLSIGREDVQQKGEDRVYVPIVVGCQAIHKLGGIVTVHAGKKTNSIENLANADKVKQSIKQDLANECIHAFEVGQLIDCTGYREKVFPHLGKPFPLLICSDNHDIRNYNVKCSMWIKADPNFFGLLQIINEPEDRIFLGDEPPSDERLRLNPTKYISSVKFERTAFATPDQKWFSSSVALNQGLIAMIGNKGSGKSALADVLGLLGNSPNSDSFSFLNREKFRNPKNNLAKGFEASIEWASATFDARRLDETVDLLAPQTLKYIPQNYLETICTELKQGTDTKFDQELRSVIFSHVPEADRLAAKSLTELLEYKTAEAKQRIRYIQNDLERLNNLIADLEYKSTEEYKKSLDAQLKRRQADLEAHDKLKPIAIPSPASDPVTQVAQNATTNSLNSAKNEQVILESQITAEREREKTAAARSATADKLLSRIANLERQHNVLLAEAAAEAFGIGIDLTQIVRLHVNRQAIEEVKQEADIERRSTLQRLGLDVANSLPQQLRTCIAKQEQFRLLLDEPNRAYQVYLSALKQWQEKQSEILGDLEVTGSINALIGQVQEINNLPKQLDDLRNRRDVTCHEIYGQLRLLLDEYKKLYAPVQNFIDTHPLAQAQVALQFEASIAVRSFNESFFTMISRARRGTFYGQMEGDEQLSDLIAAADFESAEGVTNFLNNMVKSLMNDYRANPPVACSLPAQLRQGLTAAELYNFLFSLDYLEPRFVLRWQDKDLDQLSPGERGTLLLIFYLLIDKVNVPLVIDQPEENLDNQTIAAVLVPCIKDARLRRQIVIVTHNPNLAVVCDADQIIHASIDKTDGNAIKYTSGAIENPEINRLIVDVLEGTKVAFDLRDAKYDIINRDRE